MIRGSERGYLSNLAYFDIENDNSNSNREVSESANRKKMCRSKAQCNMVMVDQLWLWILGGKSPHSLSPDTVVAQLTRGKILS